MGNWSEIQSFPTGHAGEHIQNEEGDRSFQETFQMSAAQNTCGI
jgi:hypothetical protein